MNEDTINDLKQFITTTVSQQTSDIRDDIEKLDNKLSGKIYDLSASVAEAMDNTNEAVDTQLKDHEARIGRLEQKAA